MDPYLPTERERVWLEGDRTVCLPRVTKNMTLFNKRSSLVPGWNWPNALSSFGDTSEEWNAQHFLFLLSSLTFKPAPSPRSLWGRCPVIELSSSSFMQSTGSEADVKRRAKGYQFRIRSLKRDWDLRSSQILQLNHWFFFIYKLKIIFLVLLSQCP